MPKNGWSVRPGQLVARLSKFEIRDFKIKITNVKPVA